MCFYLSWRIFDKKELQRKETGSMESPYTNLLPRGSIKPTFDCRIDDENVQWRTMQAHTVYQKSEKDRKS